MMELPTENQLRGQKRLTNNVAGDQVPIEAGCLCGSDWLDLGCVMGSKNPL